MSSGTRNISFLASRTNNSYCLSYISYRIILFEGGKVWGINSVRGANNLKLNQTKRLHEGLLRKENNQNYRNYLQKKHGFDEITME